LFGNGLPAGLLAEKPHEENIFKTGILNKEGFLSATGVSE
jgi:hypothetical protein